MDKTFAFIMIGFFTLCSCFITWAAVGEPKRNSVCKWLALGYATLVWILIISLVIFTLIY